MLLRLLCRLKLVRIARMIKTIQLLDSLQVLIGSISACTSVLVWSASVLGLTMSMISILLNALLMSCMKAETEDCDITEDTRLQLYIYFGSFSRSMYTMFEVTLGNFVPVTRFLTENIS